MAIFDQKCTIVQLSPTWLLEVVITK